MGKMIIFEGLDTPGLVVMHIASAAAVGDSVELTIFGEAGEPPKPASIRIPMPIHEAEDLAVSLRAEIVAAEKNARKS